MKKILTLVFISLSLIVKADMWTQKAGFPGIGRDYGVGFSIGTKGYLGCGYNYDGNSYTQTNDFWEYDPSLNIWTQKADFPLGRNNSVGFSIGMKGYVCTGANSLTQQFYNDLWEYDPTTNHWTQKASFGGTIRANAVGFTIGTNAYVGTGGYISFYSDFWKYNSITDSWTQIADFGGGARFNAAGFAIGTKGYVGTGGFPVGNYHNDFWEYDPGTNIWTQKAGYGGGHVVGAIAFSINTKGYIGIGIDSFGTQAFWEYNYLTDSWIQKSIFTAPDKENTVGFSIGNKGYVGTGSNGYTIPTYYNDFWEYTPDSITTTFEQLPIQNQLITLSPNPFHDKTVLTIAGTIAGASLYIYNLEGKVVNLISVGTNKQITIPRNNLPAGIYFYQLKSAENAVAATGKLLAE